MVAASLVLMAPAACGESESRVKGNGEVASETRMVAAFDRLDATDGTADTASRKIWSAFTEITNTPRTAPAASANGVARCTLR